MTDAEIAALFSTPRTIALVGASANAARPSHDVGLFLAARGHRVIGVNPGLGGKTLFGERVAAQIADVPAEADIVDIFRQSDAVPGIVEQALARWPRLKVVWMQLGVESAEGAALARAQGVQVVQNRCPKIEYMRLGL